MDSTESFTRKITQKWQNVASPYGNKHILKQKNLLSPLTPDSPGKLNVLGHDGNTLGMDGAEVSVFKQSNEVRLGRLL